MIKVFKISFVVCILLIIGCQQVDRPEKPDNLIEEDKMTDMLYDISLLNALRSYSLNRLKSSGINPDTFIYQKYQVDSTQFAKSLAYYTVQFNQYNAMWEEVHDRLERKRAEVSEAKSKADSIANANRLSKKSDIKPQRIQKIPDTVLRKQKKDSIL